MIFSEMLSQFYQKLQESSANTAFPESTVKNWINEGYRQVSSFFDWDWLLTDYSVHLVHTNCSDAGVSTGTNLFVDDVSGMQAGGELWVSDGARFEKVRISYIDAPLKTVTLQLPGLAGVYNDGDAVSSAGVFLPDDFRKMLEVKVENADSSGGSVLIFVDRRDFEISIPVIRVKGMPTHYYLGVPDNTHDGGYTADNGTSEYQVKESNLRGHEEGYYNRWKLVNVTRGGTARVQEYSHTNHVLELKTGITSQQAGDVFYLERDLTHLYLYPAPDATYRLTVVYFKTPPDLYRDYDIPFLGPGREAYHHLPVEYALAEAFLCDRNQQLASAHRQKFNDQLSRLKSEHTFRIDRTLNFRTASDRDLPGFYL